MYLQQSAEYIIKCMIKVIKSQYNNDDDALKLQLKIPRHGALNPAQKSMKECNNSKDSG